MSENLILSPLLLLFFVSRRTSPNLGLSNCIISSFNKAFNAYVLLVAKTLRVVESGKFTSNSRNDRLLRGVIPSVDIFQLQYAFSSPSYLSTMANKGNG